jgi:hypothetical protein
MIDLFIGSHGKNLHIKQTACLGSAADPPDTDFHPSPFQTRILDPTTATKEKWGENLLSYLICSYKYHKIGDNFILNW